MVKTGLLLKINPVTKKIILIPFHCRAFKWTSEIFIYSFPFIIYPLNNISFCGSIFTTVALAYERYIAVCRPLHYRDVTARYSIRRRTLR